jgi:phosphate uptake regulator
METRKIQTVGNGTYTVSLPKEWAEREGVDAGDVVDVHTHLDGLLVVQPRDTPPDDERAVTVPVDGTPDAVERAVRAAYAAGCEAVTLDTAGELAGRQRATLGRVVRNLTGVTVGDDGRTVRVLLDAEEVSVRQSVRQLRFVALSMHDEATAALFDGDPTGVDRDDQADRLYAMVDRHLARALERLDEVDALGVTRSELFELWATARELERVADGAERIGRVAETLDGVDERTADPLRALAGDARSAVDDAVDALVGDAGIDAARRALDARDAVREDAAALDRRLFESTTADYRLVRVLDVCRRTAEHGGTIAELALRAAVRRGDAPTPTEPRSPAPADE